MRDMPGQVCDCVNSNGCLPKVGLVGLGGLHPDYLQFSGVSDHLSTAYKDVGMTANRQTSNFLVGVILSDERCYVKTQKGRGDCCHVVLGVLLVENVNMKAEELRRSMCLQLPALPASFTFLTKQGWPILKDQEHIITASHLITDQNTLIIRKQFERPRVGIITTNGDCLGFIFVDFNWSVQQVRTALNEQLRDVNRKIKLDYKFVEHNGWPVATTQENLLTLLDILTGHQICIQQGDRLPPSPELKLPVPSTSLQNPTDHAAQDTIDGILVTKKLSNNFKSKIDSIKKKDVEPKKTKGDLVAKPILISYVRAEASQHALDLKEHLSKLGFSVYLDVHEIKTGSDWQDALNYAVSNCQFFVPLITPMYGKTRWTNREVKLADVLGKSIVPVNFLDYWPPECLAIQFASTQYIPSRPQDGDHCGNKSDQEKLFDSRVWDTLYIQRVSEKIADRCIMICKQMDRENRDPKFQYRREFKMFPKIKMSMKSRGGASMERYKIVAPPEFQSIEDEIDSGQMQSMSLFATESCPSVSRKEKGKKLIVISAHPKQKLLAHQLKNIFEEEGYDVWCSIELQDTFEPDCSQSNLNSPRDLPSIPETEGETVFSQTYKEIENCIAESRKIASLRAECEIFEKRPLSRMISQVSDISQISSLTPDKMELLHTFQKKTDQAGVVIVIVSEAYTKSKTSQRQVFYCEHRKQVILVKYDQSVLPSWFTMLMGNDMLSNVSSQKFLAALELRVKRALNPAYSETPKDAASEAKMQFLVNFMKTKLPLLETCVYIAGSGKLQSARSEEICRAIGRELAKVKNLTLVTGGFYGAADIVAKTFFDAKENNKNLIDNLNSSEESCVVHLLPRKDSKDFSSKALQNAEGFFEAVPYGNTIFLGDSVKEREAAVARLFDTCIVIEGGPGAAHEVEEFIWNDHFVIPIISTGGAAGGQYGVPLKIFEAPPSVSETNWSVLSEKEASPAEVAKAVVNIVMSLKGSIASYNINQTINQVPSIKQKQRKRIRSRKTRAARNLDKEREVAAAIKSHMEEGNSTSLKSSTSVDSLKNSRWQKFLRVFAATKH